MALTLIIEDGSGVADANSYVTVAEVTSYAAQRGVVLPVDNDSVIVLLIKAMDWLQAQTYKGTETHADQSLKFPRMLPPYNSADPSANSIPKEVKAAQNQLACIASDGTDLMPTTDGKFITKQIVGPIETDYSEKIYNTKPQFPGVTAGLSKWLGSSNVSGGFGQVRVCRG